MDNRFLLTCNRFAITTVIADCTEGTMPLSISKLLSHTASIAIPTTAMDLAFMVELEMPDCLKLFQLMAPPQRVDTYPEVDYLDFIFDWN